MSDYPDKEELEQLQGWEAEDLDGLMEFLIDGHWWNPDWGIHRNDDGAWLVSTGGWSGNEDRIESMQENFMWWTMNWQQTRRGGHYIFQNINIAARSLLKGGDDAQPPR